MTAPLPFYIRPDDPPAKREILRAALALFSERGLAATSIRDIAEESGYTNPALYKHFAGKDELALYLFELCHARVWTACEAVLSAADSFDEKLEAYVERWLRFLDEEPEVIAFLSDSARALWPRAKRSVRRRTMIGLATSLVSGAPSVRKGRGGRRGGGGRDRSRRGGGQRRRHARRVGKDDPGGRNPGACAAVARRCGRPAAPTHRVIFFFRGLG